MIAERTLHFMAPGDLTTGTGGYVYDRRIVAGLAALGWHVTVHGLDASFPHPSAAALGHAQRALADLPAHAMVLIDGLALGAMPELLRAQAPRLQLLGLVHMPLAAEVGLPADVARRLRQSERQALAAVRHVIVTSHCAQRMVRGYGVAPERVSVIEPGTDEAPLARPRAPLPSAASPDGVRMLCVATVNAGKGHELLAAALAPLAPRCWRLTCVGSLTRDAPAVARLRARLRELALGERVRLIGEVDHGALGPYFADADLFVLATRFETYGMAVAEALAHGLPVLSTRTGAIEELVGTAAGLLVAPDDGAALQAALARVLEEPGLLVTLARGAAVARDRLPRWRQRCARLSGLLQELAVGRVASPYAFLRCRLQDRPA